MRTKSSFSRIGDGLFEFVRINFFLIALILVGCGGGVGGTGGGGGGDGSGGGGGVGGTGVVAMGAVSKTEPATLTVNGTAFQITADTKVLIDAQPAQVTDLQLGMVVEIDAYKDTTTAIIEAEVISYKNALTGPISTINPDCRSMVVLGQTVKVNTHTLPSLTHGLCDFGVGQIVEVSGYVIDPGTNSILATFIRAKAPSQHSNVSGIVAGLSIPQKIFLIGALTVDYAGATVEPVGATLAAGQRVEVKGIITGVDAITATEIEIHAQGLGGTSGTEIEVTGFVRNLNGSNFTVNGQAVNGGAATISGALSNGVAVHVHGKLDANDAVIATEIEVKEAELPESD